MIVFNDKNDLEYFLDAAHENKESWQTEKEAIMSYADEMFLEPKEKVMENKVIFENEEECRTYWNDCGLYHPIDIEDVIKRSKRFGYIRKSPVEEAEEIIRELKYCKNHKDQQQRVELYSVDAVKIYDAFQYLKSENERLRK